MARPTFEVTGTCHLMADNLHERGLELGVTIFSITLQVIFRRVTGKHLALSLRRRLILHFLFPSCMAVIIVYLNMYDQRMPFWRMPSFYILLLQINLCTAFREMEYHALQLTSITFVGQFKVNTSRTLLIF
jgi:hypothetical protein